MVSDQGNRWQPAVSPAMLRKRAELLRSIRNFMQARNILEVETPSLVNHPVTEVNIDCFSTVFEDPGNTGLKPLYLHTSPEYAMKRLLASGSGPIYQICKVFRNNEAGALHNPEFTMLEWYMPGHDHLGLIGELDNLLVTLGLAEAEKKSYMEVFRKETSLDPHTCKTGELRHLADRHGFAGQVNDRAILLDFLFSRFVIPALGRDKPVIIYDFPACQAALSQLSETDPVVARRFELFIRGMEIANGFHELLDMTEQKKRFDEDNSRRVLLGKPVLKADEFFLSALEHGLPDCAGLALGIDRLLMVMHQCDHINEVLAFPVGRA